MALSKITNSGVAASGIPTGGVIQTVVGTMNGGTSTLTDPTTYTDTGLTVNITPKFSTSNIFVIATQVIAVDAGVNNTRCDYRLLATQDSTDTVVYDARYFGHNGTTPILTQMQCAAMGLFDVGSTNQCTFHTEMRAAVGSTNEASSDSFINWYTGSKYSIVAMEIAG